jgi:hypothetical protein
LKRKSLVVATLAAAVSAAVVATVAFAAGGGKSSSGITIRLIEKSQSFHYVDNPPIQTKQMFASQGDIFALTSNLLTTAGKQAGQLRASCVVTNGGNHPFAVCTGTFGLAGGQLAAVATIPLFGNFPTHVAIVGGTGAYEGARGSALSVPKNQNVNIDTIHLLK